MPLKRLNNLDGGKESKVERDKDYVTIRVAKDFILVAVMIAVAGIAFAGEWFWFTYGSCTGRPLYPVTHSVSVPNASVCKDCPEPEVLECEVCHDKYSRSYEISVSLTGPGSGNRYNRLMCRRCFAKYFPGVSDEVLAGEVEKDCYEADLSSMNDTQVALFPKVDDSK